MQSRPGHLGLAAEPGQGVAAMQTVELPIENSTSSVIATRVWRELGQLALEGMVIGLAFSILLAAAVYMIARNARDDALYTTHVSPAIFAMGSAVG
jgi:hypothetical protein